MSSSRRKHAAAPREKGGTLLLAKPALGRFPTESEAALPRPRGSVAVTYPAENETVGGPEYAIQVAADFPAESVEVSLDQGDWRPCREALGLWWYDWRDFDPGEHEVTARARSKEGKTETSEPRIFLAS